MNIIPTYDMSKIKEILMIDEVWDRAAEDGLDKNEFYPSFDAMSGWLLCVDGSDIVGIFLIHNDNTRSIKIHPYILPESRGKGGGMMRAFYRWLISSCPSVDKVIITIPACYKRVYKFARSVGFIDEGINRMSYVKKGKLYDQWNLGLTRNEIEELIR